MRRLQMRRWTDREQSCTGVDDMTRYRADVRPVKVHLPSDPLSVSMYSTSKFSLCTFMPSTARDLATVDLFVLVARSTLYMI